jgi:6,7-dimethyl-8-ribityllumazine synthase
MIKNILIVKSIYYEDISKVLYKNALEIIGDHKKNYCVTNTYSVPGIFEIPAVISKHIKAYYGVVALGCVIKGKTPHFDFISRATTDAIMKLSIEHQKPIGNGIITCLNKKQALVRSKTKGQEAAKAVLSVLKSFENPPE